MRTAAHSLLCILLSTGCVGEPEDRSAITGSPVIPIARDSAGITILEHSANARAAAPQLTVDSVPLAVIGAREDGSDEVTNVRGVVLLSDDAIAFGNDAQSQLLIYEANGSLRKRVGRRGGGPEDFGSIDAISATRDTLFVPDFGNDRLALYDASLNRIGTVRGIRACGSISPVGRLSGGAIIADEGSVLKPAPLTNTIARPPVALVSLGDGRCDTLRFLRGREIRVLEARQRGRAFLQTRPILFGRAATTAVWDSLIAVGTADAYQIDLLDEHGMLRMSIRSDVGRIEMPAGARDSVIARRRAQAGGGGERAIDPIEQERLLREATFVADSVALYDRFLVSNNGLLWVVEGWAPGMPERSATAFRSDGGIAAHLRIPAALMPMAFGSDRVLVRTEDPETGIVTFRSLRLIPRSP
ncbi:MAG TPA: 6-bladed beta-propeller [Gemmatimonadales bacterium]|nr:6-bladed beta-propeller [Gemmatimonadales bacterium]